MAETIFCQSALLFSMSGGNPTRLIFNISYIQRNISQSLQGRNWSHQDDFGRSRLFITIQVFRTDYCVRIVSNVFLLMGTSVDALISNRQLTSLEIIRYLEGWLRSHNLLKKIDYGKLVDIKFQLALSGLILSKKTSVILMHARDTRKLAVRKVSTSRSWSGLIFIFFTYRLAICTVLALIGVELAASSLDRSTVASLKELLASVPPGEPVASGGYLLHCCHHHKCAESVLVAGQGMICPWLLAYLHHLKY